MSAESIILPPGAGRAYVLVPMRGVFKADGPETDDRYCASEWSVEPGRPGPGAHHHVFIPGGFEAPLRDWIEEGRQ